ncbi:MAG: hypothetical protein ABEJ73_04650 [Haloplanus sp.]
MPPDERFAPLPDADVDGAYARADPEGAFEAADEMSACRGRRLLVATGLRVDGVDERPAGVVE